MIRFASILTLSAILLPGPCPVASAVPRVGMGLPADSLPPAIAALRVFGRGAVPIDQRLGRAQAYIDSVNRAGDATGYDRALGLGVLVETRLSLGERMDESLHLLAGDVRETMRAVLGPDHAEHARALVNLGRIETWVLNRPGQGDSTLMLAGSILERCVGPDSPDLAHVLRFRAEARSWAGDYPASIALAERGIAILERSAPPDTSMLNQLLSSFADGLRQAGRVEEAIAAVRRLDQSMLMYNPGNIRGRAINHANLGTYLLDVGQYAQAQEHLELYERFIDSTGVGDHLNRRLVLALLASCRLLLGDERGAEDAITQALRPGPGLPPDHVMRTPILFVAAQLEAYRGRWAAARRWMVESDRVCRLSLGDENPRCLPGAALVARCFMEEGKADSALVIARAARLGLERRGVVSASLYDFALLEAQASLALADTAASLRLLEAIAAEGRAIGIPVPVVSLARLERARLAAAGGDPGTAIELALVSESEQQEWMRGEIAVLPVDQMLSLHAGQNRGLDVALDLLRRFPEARRGWSRPVFDAIVRSRAGLLDAVGARRAALGETAPEDSIQTRYRRARSRLHSRLYASAGRQDPDSVARELSELRAELHDAEKALLRRTGWASGGTSPGGRVSLAEVERSLPPNSALLSFKRVRPRGPVRVSQGSRFDSERAAYVVFVLRSGDETPVLVDLGAADSLESTIAVWRRDPGTDLGGGLWRSIAAELQGVTRVFLVLDGALAGVPFETIEVSPGRFLADEPLSLEVLVCERELVVAPRTRREGRFLLALGGADHDLRSDGARRELLSALDGVLATDGPHRPAVFRGFLESCTDFSTHVFQELPAAELEVREIIRRAREQVPPVSITGLVAGEASESAVRRMAPLARGVHIAAHGFYVHPACDSIRATDPVVPSRWLDRTAQGPGGDPLTRCGLALAGANRRAEAGPDEDDGLLTGDEIAALDLSGVEFVVLSACNSGLGDVLDGEGVLGLQRAFKIAGAGPVVMSLWPVEDQATRQWMRHFYAARLTPGVTTAEATRRASLAMLKERRRLGLSTRPSTWGAFVSVGVER